MQGIRDSIKAFRTKSQAEQDAETQRARVIEQAEKDRIAALAAQREAEKEAESERLRSAESDRQRKEASERRTRSIEEQSNAYRRADQAHWEQAADDDTIEAYNTYLAQYPYPYGRMNSDAHLRIKELKKQNAAPIPWGRYVAIGGGLLALMLVLLWEYSGGSKNDEGTSSQPIIIDTVRRDMPDEFNKQDSVLLVPIQQSKQGLEATHIKKKKRQPTKPTKPDDSFGNEIDTIDKKSFFRRIFSQRAKPDSF